MSIIQGNAKQGSTRGFYNFPIEQSLRFNDDDSAYLSWTPDSAGNRKTWTWSGWVKRANVGNGFALFGMNGFSDKIWFIDNGGDAKIAVYIGAGAPYSVFTNASFRDPSAWYHIVVQLDTTQATDTNRVKVYVNGVQQSYYAATYPTQNYDGNINTANQHNLGARESVSSPFDGYLAEVNFIDGTAYDADSFGELKNGVWIPKDPSGLTYGTNGFRLSFADDAEVEAFNTVLYRGNATDGNQVTGVGFKPDLIWTKTRDSANEHFVMDSVRGTGVGFEITSTYGDITGSQFNESFDPDGFTVNSGARVNRNGEGFVAWCWKAGDSNVSNTDGSITSTVRANDTYGFSIVSYEGNAANSTVGHGLSSAPDMVIVKNRETGGTSWRVYHSSLTSASYYLMLDDSTGELSGTYWNNTAPTSSVFSLGTGSDVNQSGIDHIAYCWAEKAGYSKFDGYSGTGAERTITTGFKPSLVIIKRTDTTSHWVMYDDNRKPNGINAQLYADLSAAEDTNGTINADPDFGYVDFTDTGFTLPNYGATNASGGTYIYAAFADTREAAFWLDQSGNDNDWQPVNLDHNDTVADSPTDNFATMNPLDSNGATLSDGNLVMATPASGGGNTRATMAVSSGQWYWEATLTSGNQGQIGIQSSADAIGSYLENGTVSTYGYVHDGYKFINGSFTAGYGASYTTGDTIGVALDLDAGTLTMYKNGVSQGVLSSSVASGYTYHPAFSDSSNTGQVTWSVNFGQQPFKYDPPA